MGGQEAGRRDPTPAILRVALAGDVLITRSINRTTNPRTVKLAEILRRNDVGFANLETLFHDYEGWAASESGGTYLRSDPRLVDDLGFFGINLVSRANNHAGDYQESGLQLTSMHLDRAGIPHAGVGSSRGEAEQARYVDASEGRLALISATTTSPAQARAGEARAGIPGRPGANVIRHRRQIALPIEELDTIRRIAAAAGDLRGTPTGVLAFGIEFVAGQRAGYGYVADRSDVRRLLQGVATARRAADCVLVSLHGHEQRDLEPYAPPDLQIDIARAAVDAGASIVACHGVHVARAIERRGDAVICYGLGSLFFQNETVDRLPADAFESLGLDSVEQNEADFHDHRYDRDRRGLPTMPTAWESIVVEVEVLGGAVQAVRVHPVTLGFGQPPHRRGVPELAEGARAEAILARVASLSRVFDTEVFVHGASAAVRPKADLA